MLFRDLTDCSMGTKDSPDNTVKAVETTFRILETIRKEGDLRLTEISNKTGFAKSTVHRYLKTMESNGYLVRRGDRYEISHRFFQFITSLRTNKARYDPIKQKVRHIANETGELAQFVIEEHWHAVYVYQSTGERGVKLDTKPGTRGDLHSTAGGKAILSTWTNERVSEYIQREGLPKHASNTITTEEELFQELERIRERGYSVNSQESIDGLKAVSVPITEPDGKPIGALSLSGPTNRMTGEYFGEEIPNLLLGVGNELELNYRFLSNNN